MADYSKPKAATRSVATKSVSAVSSPTAFKVSRYRWWIPRFVYQAVINDIDEIALNQIEGNDLANTSLADTTDAANPPSDPKRKANT